MSVKNAKSKSKVLLAVTVMVSFDASGTAHADQSGTSPDSPHNISGNTN